MFCIQSIIDFLNAHFKQFYKLPKIYEGIKPILWPSPKLFITATSVFLSFGPEKEIFSEQ